MVLCRFLSGEASWTHRLRKPHVPTPSNRARSCVAVLARRAAVRQIAEDVRMGSQSLATNEPCKMHPRRPPFNQRVPCSSPFPDQFENSWVRGVLRRALHPVEALPATGGARVSDAHGAAWPGDIGHEERVPCLRGEVVRPLHAIRSEWNAGERQHRCV